MTDMKPLIAIDIDDVLIGFTEQKPYTNLNV